MAMQRDRARIPCPRCRVNNFPGQTNCWQCGGSLPPPDAVSRPAAPPPAPAPVPASVEAPQRPGWPPSPASPAYQRRTTSTAPQGSRWAILLPALLLAVMLVAGALWMAYSRRASTRTSPDVAAQLDALQAQKERLLRQEPPLISNPAALDPDSPEGRAQAELRRLRAKYNLSAPPADAEGRIHLQGGGTLSREEWEHQRDRLNAPPR